MVGERRLAGLHQALEDDPLQALSAQRFGIGQNEPHQLRLTGLDPGNRRRHEQQRGAVLGYVLKRGMQQRRRLVAVGHLDGCFGFTFIHDDYRGFRDHAVGVESRAPDQQGCQT